MSSSSMPNWNLFISTAFGDTGSEGGGSGYGLAPFQSGVVCGANPYIDLTYILPLFPQFFGTPLTVSGTITQGSPVITGLSSTAGLLPGQIISQYIALVDPITQAISFQTGNFPQSTFILSVDSPTQITATMPATLTGALVSIYNSPVVPYFAMTMYLNLASASLVSARYGSLWLNCIALYWAHFVTLWLRSSGTATSNAGALAVMGLAKGFTVSKSAGGVSTSVQAVTQGFQNWGSFQQTQFGEQLLLFMASAGAGCVLLY